MRALPALVALVCAGCSAGPAATVTGAPVQPRSAADAPDTILAAVRAVRRAVVVDRPRPPVAPRRFVVGELPRGPADVRPVRGELVLRRVAGDDPRERLARLDVRGRLFGQVTLGDAVGFVGEPFADQAGTSVGCGGSHGDWVLWEGLAVDARGAATWTAGEGWFDPVACTARSIRAGTWTATALVPDGVYAFVRCGPICDEDAALVVLVPETTTLATSNALVTPRGARAVARVELPLGPKGAWLAAQVRRGALADFHAGTRPRPAKVASADDDPPEPAVAGSDLFVVEVLGAARPLEAVALAYVVPLAENGTPDPPAAP